MFFFSRKKKSTPQKNETIEKEIKFPKNFAKSIDNYQSILIEEELIRQKELFVSLFKSYETYSSCKNEKVRLYNANHNVIDSDQESVLEFIYNNIKSNDIDKYLNNFKHYSKKLNFFNLIEQNEDLTNTIRSIENNNAEESNNSNEINFKDFTLYELANTSK